MSTDPVREGPDAQPPARRALRVAGSVLFWALAAVAVWLAWPTSLGGCTTLTVVSGHSMEPTYYTGDLVISRCEAPHVGDVVVYQPSGMGGARVIHRLIGGDGERGWQVQGDNNPWVDPFTPTNDAVVGVAKVHIPKVGLVARGVTSPYVWGSLILVALALLLWPRAEDDEDDPENGEPENSEADDDARADDERSAAPAGRSA